MLSSFFFLLLGKATNIRSAVIHSDALINLIKDSHLKAVFIHWVSFIHCGFLPIT